MNEVTKMVKISSINVGKHEQRISDDDEDFAGLVHSIGDIGLIHAVVVVPHGEEFVLVAGHRRLQAHRKLGYHEIKCTVRESNSTVDAAITFAENFFKRDLTPIERAAAIKDNYEKGVMSVQQLAKVFHRTENWVAAQMAMVSWPEDVLSAIHQDLISVSAASNLAQITDEAYRRFLLETAVTSGATARSTAAWLQGWNSQKTAEDAVEEPPLAGQQPQQAIIPKMPCLCCSTVLRMDQMSHVPMCQACIRDIRNATQQG